MTVLIYEGILVTVFVRKLCLGMPQFVDEHVVEFVFEVARVRIPIVIGEGIARLLSASSGTLTSLVGARLA